MKSKKQKSILDFAGAWKDIPEKEFKEMERIRLKMRKDTRLKILEYSKETDKGKTKRDKKRFLKKSRVKKPLNK